MKTFTACTLTLLLAVACGNMNSKKNAMEEGNVETAENMNVAVPDTYGEAGTSTLSALTQETEGYDTLNLALAKANLLSTLNEDIPYTLFAPTNAAFSRLPGKTLDNLLSESNESQLIGLLTYHLISGKYTTDDIENGIRQNNGSYTLETLEGARLTFTLEDSGLVVTDTEGNTANIVSPDLEASNGLMHGIDQVVRYN